MMGKTATAASGQTRSMELSIPNEVGLLSPDPDPDHYHHRAMLHQDQDRWISAILHALLATWWVYLELPLGE